MILRRVTVTDASGGILFRVTRYFFLSKEIKVPVNIAAIKGTVFVRVELGGQNDKTITVILQ